MLKMTPKMYHMSHKTIRLMLNAKIFVSCHGALFPVADTDQTMLQMIRPSGPTSP